MTIRWQLTADHADTRTLAGAVTHGSALVTAALDASLLDLGGDGCGGLYSAADRAQPVMRFPDRIRQNGPGLVAARAAWKRNLEGDPDAGEPVTACVADLVRVGPHLEPVGFGPARGKDVDVDRRATGDCGQQQFGRGEVGIAARAEPELAAAGVGYREYALGDALDGHGTVQRTISHTPYLARQLDARPGRRSSSPRRSPARTINAA